MERHRLDDSWEYAEADLMDALFIPFIEGWSPVNLPHDHAVEMPRDERAPAGTNEGFFQGSALYYRKTFVLEAAPAHSWIEFEGIAGVAEIWLNGTYLGSSLNPYTGALFDITAIARTGANQLLVHVDGRAKPNSRWYTGCGINRHVWLLTAGAAYVEPYSPSLKTTLDSAGRAHLSVSGNVVGSNSVVLEIVDAERQTVASEQCQTSRNGQFRADIELASPHLWNCERPHLYTLRIVTSCNHAHDVWEQQIGIRTVRVDAHRGLLLNGEPLLLRGGCIHEDLGLLGTATHDAAVRWRIRHLKRTGFNAIRLSHNPFGPSLYSICDQEGMLVVDELFDEWAQPKTSFGTHLWFADRWKQELASVVRRDRLHPCVIMWSIGNEVAERDGSGDGAAWSRRLADAVRALDNTRPVSVTACAVTSEYSNVTPEGLVGNQAFNMSFDTFETNDQWGPATEGYFASVDVAGYNYKSFRFEHDRMAYPKRVTYGSESKPRDALTYWNLTESVPGAIGDFVWTAWDYLGEAGIGRWEIGNNRSPSPARWPWMAAWCGDFDLTGNRRPQSYYRELVWNRANGPKIFCLPPALTGKLLSLSGWSWLPAERNYTFPRDEGRPVEVHVYAHADRVELTINGKVVEMTTEDGLDFTRTVSYEPGELVAIAYRDGRELGRDTLRSADKTTGLRLTAERVKGLREHDDLAFVHIQAVDKVGTPCHCESRPIEASATGCTLISLGSADPKPNRKLPFSSHEPCPLFQGQAMAIVKPGCEAGAIEVRLGSLSSYLSIE